MSSLALDDIQRQFWTMLKYPTKAIQINSDLNTLIYADENFTAAERVGVYQTTARSLHVSVLADIYPVCKKILGDNYFKLIAKHFYYLYPSESPDLNQYGKQFPAYILNLLTTRDELRDFSYLSDLAKLEWSLERLRFSHDAETLDMQTLQNKCERYGGKVKFSLISGLILLESAYPVAEIWRQHQLDNEYKSIQGLEEKQLMCVYRDGYNVELEVIDKHIYDLMQCIQQHLSLAEIVDNLENSELLNDALTFVISKHWLYI